jgi:hypothetical protein
MQQLVLQVKKQDVITRLEGLRQRNLSYLAKLQNMMGSLEVNIFKCYMAFYMYKDCPTP